MNKIICFMMFAILTSCSSFYKNRFDNIISSEMKKRMNQEEETGINAQVVGSIETLISNDFFSSSVGRGSGIFVTYKNHDFFLTNEHVCKSKSKNPEYYIKLNSLKFRGEIHIKDNKKIISSVEKDICLIPLQNMREYASFLSLDDLNHLENNLNYCFITKNNNEVSHKSYSFCGKSLGGNNYDITNIPGDSGSPLFNSKNNFVGIIKGTHINLISHYAVIVPKKEIIELLNIQLK